MEHDITKLVSLGFDNFEARQITDLVVREIQFNKRSTKEQKLFSYE